MGPILGAISNLGGQIFGNWQRRKAEDRQYNRNVEFWKMQNEYNHPVQQMARLKEAGLNPRLVYGQQSGAAAGNTSSGPQGVDPQVAQLDLAGPMNQIYDLALKSAQTDNVKQMTRTDAEREGLVRSQSWFTDLQRTGKSYENKAFLKMFPWQLEAQKEQVRQARIERSNKQNIIDTTISNMKSNTRLNNLKNELIDIGIAPNSPYWWQALGAWYRKNR
jgi:hypothetical protein